MDPRTRRMVAELPRDPGVYRFRDARGRVLYVGRATRLRDRVASYWSNLADRQHLAVMVRRIDRIEATVCGSQHEAAWLERNLLENRMPPWNRTAGGQEVPVFVRLDARPGAPGLRVVHECLAGSAVTHFGPYLGGLRVRQAVAGLHRVLPLAYTGTRLSGSELDLARLRGLDHRDRVVLIDALLAVLAREPDAVARTRTGLVSLRDRAADTLAFELAARITTEIDGYDWITGPQRVTVPEPADLDVYGASGGIVVRFSVRAGRLCTWSQRACSSSVAARHVGGTPAQWIEFAQRNAELAAALSRS